MNWMLDAGYWMLVSQFIFPTSESSKDPDPEDQVVRDKINLSSAIRHPSSVICHLTAVSCVRGVKHFNLLTDSAKEYTENLLNTVLIIVNGVLKFILF